MTSRCGAIILAAGQSRRMGANKLVADLDGKPIIAHVADAIDAAGLPPPIVVLGHDANPVRQALRDRSAAFVLAEDHAEGMARSLAAGIAVVPSAWDAAIICLGDMPLIPPLLLRRMADKASLTSIIIPTFEGRRGNPVLWGRGFFPELRKLEGDIGARRLFESEAGRIETFAWTDDSILRDVDTIAALDAIRQQSRRPVHHL